MLIILPTEEVFKTIHSKTTLSYSDIRKVIEAILLEGVTLENDNIFSFIDRRAKTISGSWDFIFSFLALTHLDNLSLIKVEDVSALLSEVLYELKDSINRYMGNQWYTYKFHHWLDNSVCLKIIYRIEYNETNNSAHNRNNGVC